MLDDVLGLLGLYGGVYSDEGAVAELGDNVVFC